MTTDTRMSGWTMLGISLLATTGVAIGHSVSLVYGTECFWFDEVVGTFIAAIAALRIANPPSQQPPLGQQGGTEEVIT